MLSRERRFWSKVDVRAGQCWLWRASTTGTGYGKIWWNGRLHQAHRISFELKVGPIPPGLVVDHLCDVRRCVNPAHLRATTQRRNLLRSDTLPARNAAKTHCLRGHPLSGGNLYVAPIAWGQTRHCKKCRADLARLRYTRKEKKDD